MAIVKQLSDVHGGHIQAESRGKGHGATFTLDIPLSRSDAAPSPSDSQMLRNIDFSKIIAMVVEDDHDARELTRRILTDVGATVIEAASADAAVTLMEDSNVNMLISDIGMAQEDGYQLLRRLRALGYGPEGPRRRSRSPRLRGRRIAKPPWRRASRTTWSSPSIPPP